MSEERRGELAEGCAVDGPSIPPALPRELVRPVTRLSRRAPLRTQCDPCDQSVRERPPPEPPPRGAALDPLAKVFTPKREVCEREQEKQRYERERGGDDDNVSVSTAEYAAEEARWAAEDREWEQEITLRITVMLRTGLTRRRAGRRGVGSGRRRNRRAGKERKRQQQEQTRQKRAMKGWRRAELQFVQRQELKWFGKGDTDSKERLIRWKQRQVRMRARGSGIWQQQRRGQAGEHEGSAPASLRRRRVRAAGAGWGHSPRYWRLGGGGKQGWVT